MSAADATATAPQPRPAAEADLAELYRAMRRVRALEERIAALYRDGEVPGFCHVSIGQEVAPVAVCAALRRDDVITSTHRGHGHVLAKGTDPRGMFAEVMGRATGVCGGLGGSMHIADPSVGVFGANGIVGAGLPIAAGAAFALARRPSDAVAAAFFGDGAVATGAFHEAMNLAAVWQLPVLFVCENNRFAEFSPAETQHPVEPSERAVAYAMPSERVDGSDVLEVAEVAASAVAWVREHRRPRFLEVLVDRWHGHYEGDPVRYREEGHREEMQARDPLAAARARLDAAVADAIDAEVASEMDTAVAQARLDPAPEVRDLSDLVRAPARSRPVVAGDPVDDEPWRYMDAIGAAIADSLEEDPAAFLAGIDVRAGGVFRATKDLAERFSDRVLDTPISETAIVGLAVGSAMAGLRPIIEIMFVDFIGVCFDQLVNQAAKLRFMTGGAVELPLVVRTQYGAGRAAGAQHSQSLEGLMAAIPGLAVVIPSTPADAYGLLRSAVDDPNPVVVIEHRHLYGRKGPRVARDHRVPIGRAAVVRPGRHLTLVATGRLVHEGVAAAEVLAAEGIEVEVIDLRTVAPLDAETIAASVKRTGRLAVAHEAVTPYGPGGELVAGVTEAAFWDLDAPPVRIGAPATPAPYAPVLEAEWLPSRERLTHEMRQAATI